VQSCFLSESHLTYDFACLHYTVSSHLCSCLQVILRPQIKHCSWQLRRPPHEGHTAAGLAALCRCLAAVHGA
jgi:hypothetical protein